MKILRLTYTILIFSGVLILGLVPSRGTTVVEWKGTEGVLPEEASVGFVQSHTDAGSLTMGDGALIIHTLEEGGASVEYPIALSEPGASLIVEVEARSESGRDAAAIQIMSDDMGISSWLFDGNHLRVTLDGDQDARYIPVAVGERHLYRYEIEGIDVRISIDGDQVFAGKLGEPLETARLVIGDVSPGGGEMEVFRISIQYEDGEGGGHSGVSGRPETRPIVWDVLDDEESLVSQNWPAAANGLVMDLSYQAAEPRQCQWYVLCKGDRGKKIVSVANRLGSVAESALRKERFFLKIPEGTRSISIRRTLSESATPFLLKSGHAMPVEILAGNEGFDRTSGLNTAPVGQSFSVAPDRRILGIAVPVRRGFDARRVPSRLQCRLSDGESQLAAWSLPANQISRDYESKAVFMNGSSQQVGTKVRFEIGSGVAEPRFFGWYSYDLSWGDPYPNGHLYSGNREEESSDLTFFIFSAVSKS